MESLTLDESVLLVHALIADVAQRHDIRVLFIKGPVLARQGLRPERLSVDVDVLVERERSGELVTLAEDLGWVAQGPFDTPSVMRRHSVTLRHEVWPCELDVHDYFPGFLAPPDHVFDVLWRRRVEVELAQRQVPTPDPAAHAALVALHCLRDGHDGRHRDQYNDVVDRVRDWDPAMMRSLVEVALDAGADLTLAPFFRDLDVPVRDSGAYAGSLDEWALRSSTATSASLNWLVELRRTPWRQRPRLLRRAIWPTRAEMVRHYPKVAEQPSEIRKIRWRRLRQGVKNLPRAIVEVYGSKRP